MLHLATLIPVSNGDDTDNFKLYLSCNRAFTIINSTLYVAIHFTCVIFTRESLTSKFIISDKTSSNEELQTGISHSNVEQSEQEEED